MVSNNASVGSWLKQAIALHRDGQVQAAEAAYRQILGVQKRQPDAAYHLALLLHQRGDTVEALRLLDRVLKTHPDVAAVHNGRGMMLTETGRPQEALRSFDRAVALSPGHALAWINRGNCLAVLSRHEDALGSYDRALAVMPDNADAHYARGRLLQQHGQPDQALAAYDRALALKPAFPEVLNNRAALRERKGNIDDALADYARATTLQPSFAEAWNNRGVALIHAGRHAEAMASFRHAVAVRPRFIGAKLNLADMLYTEGRQQEALALASECAAGDPGDFRARLLALIFQLPVLYDTELEIEGRREAYQRSLTDLQAMVEATTTPGRFSASVAASQPFFLAYQGRVDTEIQRAYGSMVSRITAADPPPIPAPAARIRVGFVSGFFNQHPVWRIPLRGWLSHLDRTRFELIGYHTSNRRDADTAHAESLCDHFVQGPMSADAWRARIIADAPHVLVYPEIGMDPMSAQLASQRLAPVQCNALGHPETSGMPTVDYFLSSVAMEPPDGDAHYTEQLVRLPGLSVFYEPRVVGPADVTRASMGLRTGLPVFWCGQSLYKYLPQYDEVFPRIASEVGPCQFAFIVYPFGSHVTALFRARLQRAFAKHGLDAEAHCVFLPRMDGDQFAGTVGQCDIVLDSLGWAGFNSNLESMVHNRPIVAFEGTLMRGRHTAAALRLMGMHELVATTVTDYVSIAARLARDPSLRMAVGRKIADGKSRIFQDQDTITALEAFFIDAVAKAGSVAR